ncbi:MAG: zinc ribbon domain-containing protein [Gammaproteobacteria bacterium]|nr:zinc ribbon domain-containing protein [Gammaproteobacteria bacterium]
MPTYDYHCPGNGRVVEVRHRMSERLLTWGELCARAGIAPDDTPPDTPVAKLLTASQVVRNTSLGSGTAPPCETGQPCCGGGMCGLN